MPERTAEEAIGYVFSDKTLLDVCFTHASVGGENNERLEFLGDAVLELYVTEKLYRMSDAPEGKLTELRQHYVSRDALGEAAQRLGLLAYLRYSGGEDVLRGKTASNLYEAVVGAVYLDGGYGAAADFLGRTLIEQRSSNYKALLQEYVQQFEHVLPVYDTREGEGEFTATVTALGRQARGSGRNKKGAEQAAARSLYEEFTKQ